MPRRWSDSSSVETRARLSYVDVCRRIAPKGNGRIIDAVSQNVDVLAARRLPNVAAGWLKTATDMYRTRTCVRGTVSLLPCNLRSQNFKEKEKCIKTELYPQRISRHRAIVVQRLLY